MSTFREKRAVFANLGVGFVFPVSRAIGGFVGKFMFGRAQIHVFFRYVLKLPFEEQTFLGSKTPVSNHCKNFPFLQSLANGHCEITGIQSDFLYLESEPVDLSIQPFKIWHRIMNVSRRYVHIRDKIVLSVNGSVVQVEEPFGFSISNHITAVRVRGAHSDFSFFKLDSFFF
jgi:hypothetical protein